METTTRRQFKSRMDAKQDIWRPIDALMGNGSGVVEVPGQPGYVYIRTSANDLGQAFNNRCPLYDNLAISCGYDPITDPDRRIFQVLSVRMADYANAGNTPIMQVANHHLYHEFGGGDDVYVDWRRLLGFRVGRPAGFVVTVDQGVMMRAGAWTAIVAQTVDLTAAKPGGVNSARYVLIALDNTGTITTSNGAIMSAALLDISDCPVPAAGEIPLAAVRLYSSQTAISDTPGTPDIIDLRFPTTYTTGGSNVYGSGAANQFAYWSAVDTLASSAEVTRQTNTCLIATKSVAALAPATYYTGLFSDATVTAAVAQSGHLLPMVVHLTAAGAANYTGDLVGYNGVTSLSGTGTSDDVRGYDYTIQLTAAATATEAALFYGYLNAGASGIVTTGYGLRLPAPAGSIGTFYGVHVATLAAATNKWAFYSVGDKITTKQAAAAGIEFDVNAATGNFTLSLSPANLTGNRRHTLPDYNMTWPAADAAGVLTSNGAGVLSWGAAGGAHDILSATHTDTLADSVVDGDVIIGNVTPAWSRLAIAIPAANVRNALGIDNGELRPSWKTTLDATNPTTIGIADAGGPGTSLIYSHRDHQHPSPATWTAAAHNLFSAIHGDTTGAAAPVDGDIIIGNVTPLWSKLAISIPAANVRNVLGVDNGELRPSWKTALDATAPTTIAESAVAAAGTSLVFSHRDHTHGAPATWAATAHAVDGASHTVAGRTAGQVLIATAAATFGWSGFLLSGTSGGTTNFAVTNTKTLTLTATDNYNLTIPDTGTAALLGVANVFTTNNEFRLGVSSKQAGAGGIQLFHNNASGNFFVILQPASTLTGTRLVTFPDANLTFQTGGTLHLGGYTLTIPATGTAALLGEANVFTANQTISSTAPSFIMTDTTASAKSLTVAVDANVANLRESAGASGSLLALDLTNNRVGIGTAAPGVKLHAYNASGDTYYEMETDSGAAGMILDGTRTTDVYIAIIDFKNAGDDIASIRALRAGANDAASMLFFTQATGGALTARMTLGSTGGLQMGAPTGGDKGSGTINTAADIYKNNVAYTSPAYVLEKWATGKIEKHIDKQGATGYHRPTIEESERYIMEKFELHGHRDDFGIFSGGDWILEKLEELFTYTIELHHRVELLETNEKLEAANG